MPRVLVVGAGIAGSIILHGLRHSDAALDVECIEQTHEHEFESGGTGLNIGPNAVTTLRAYFPDLAGDLESAALAWREWTVKLISGEDLMRLQVERIAHNAGLRLRWSDLYRVLRRAVRDRIRFRTEFVSAEFDPSCNKLRAFIRDRDTGLSRTIDDVDLLIGCDGRFSRVRAVAGLREERRFLGAALYRLLIERPGEVAIDDYTQWFHGPHRLLAFRTIDGAIYLSGTFPLPSDAQLTAGHKTAGHIASLFANAPRVEDAAAFLLRAAQRAPNDLHWSRIHDEPVAFSARDGLVLLLGDAAHPIVPTLGQGATLTVEDGCVAQEEIRRSLDRLGDVANAVEARRGERVRFAKGLSWDASDTLLAESDPVVGTAKKTRPDFLAKLAKMYRDVPMPLTSGTR